MELDNPPGNPCWGCGPAHPRGLRLRFEREGDEVVTRVVPRDDEVGWPGLFHTGLHFAVLYEVSYWAAWEFAGHVMVSEPDAAFRQERLPRTGKAFRAAARKVGDGPLRIVAQSASEEGKPQGRLETTWKRPSRASAERAGLRLPAYIAEEMAP